MKKLLFAALFPLLLNAQNPGIKFTYIDSSVSPRQDFYTFCNGNWQKSFVLPESDARYGSFNEINENNLKKIKMILDAAAKNKAAAPNTDAQRLRDFYTTAMDSMKAEELGMTPIKAQLDRIEKVKTAEEFMLLKSEFDYIGVDLFFGVGVSPDLKNSRRNSFGISQAGFGLGDRDYYHLEQFESIRKEYKNYLAALFSLTGMDTKTAANEAEEVFEFERKLTNKAMTRVEMRDVEKLYNVYNPKMLSDLTPSIKWADYFMHKKMKSRIQ
jgi:putative endopeptidase